MPRPTTQPLNWASTGSKVAPSAGKIAAGWLVNERPPAEWLNYSDNLRDQWLQFAADISAGLPIADLLLNFANTDMEAALLRVSTAPTGTSYRLIMQFATSATRSARIYAGSGTRRLVLVHNAIWNATLNGWECEEDIAAASGIALVSDGTNLALETLIHSATALQWGDVAWGKGNIDAGTVTLATLAATTSITAPAVIGTTSVTAPTVTGTTLVTAPTITATTGLTSPTVGTDALFVAGDDLFLGDTTDIKYASLASDSGHPWRYLQLDIQHPVLWDTVSPGTLELRPDMGAIANTHATNKITVEFPFTVPRGIERMSLALTWRAFGPTIGNLAALVWWPRAMPAGVGPHPAPASTYSGIGSPIVLSAFSATDVYVDSATFTGLLVVNDDNRYSVLMDLGPGSALYGIKLGYADPGARNG